MLSCLFALYTTWLLFSLFYLPHLCLQFVCIAEPVDWRAFIPSPSSGAFIKRIMGIWHKYSTYVHINVFSLQRWLFSFKNKNKYKTLYAGFFLLLVCEWSKLEQSGINVATLVPSGWQCEALTSVLNKSLSLPAWKLRKPRKYFHANLWNLLSFEVTLFLNQ